MRLELGTWLLADGDLFRILGRSAQGTPILSNWSKPRLDVLRALWRRTFA